MYKTRLIIQRKMLLFAKPCLKAVINIIDFGQMEIFEHSGFSLFSFVQANALMLICYDNVLNCHSYYSSYALGFINDKIVVHCKGCCQICLV